jgi:hypothetical protein
LVNLPVNLPPSKFTGKFYISRNILLSKARHTGLMSDGCIKLAADKKITDKPFFPTSSLRN